MCPQPVTMAVRSPFASGRWPSLIVGSCSVFARRGDDPGLFSTLAVGDNVRTSVHVFTRIFFFSIDVADYFLFGNPGITVECRYANECMRSHTIYGFDYRISIIFHTASVTVTRVDGGRRTGRSPSAIQRDHLKKNCWKPVKTESSRNSKSYPNNKCNKNFTRATSNGKKKF